MNGDSGGGGKGAIRETCGKSRYIGGRAEWRGTGREGDILADSTTGAKEKGGLGGVRGGELLTRSINSEVGTAAAIMYF